MQHNSLLHVLSQPEPAFPVVIIDSRNCMSLITGAPDGIVVAYAAWSSYAVANCSGLPALLREKGYQGCLYYVDIDSVTADWQRQVFGIVSEGWGELFVMEQGNIVAAFTGRRCLDNFKCRMLL